MAYMRRRWIRRLFVFYSSLFQIRFGTRNNMRVKFFLILLMLMMNQASLILTSTMMTLVKLRILWFLKWILSFWDTWNLTFLFLIQVVWLFLKTSCNLASIFRDSSCLDDLEFGSSSIKLVAGNSLRLKKHFIELLLASLLFVLLHLG